MLPKKEMVRGMVQITYEFGLRPRTFAVADVGNLEKCLTDILVKRGYLEDDRKVAVIHMEKVVSPEYYVKIDIQPYGR